MAAVTERFIARSAATAKRGGASFGFRCTIAVNNPAIGLYDERTILLHGDFRNDTGFSNRRISGLRSRFIQEITERATGAFSYLCNDILRCAGLHINPGFPEGVEYSTQFSPANAAMNTDFRLPYNGDYTIGVMKSSTWHKCILPDGAWLKACIADGGKGHTVFNNQFPVSTGPLVLSPSDTFQQGIQIFPYC